MKQLSPARVIFLLLFIEFAWLLLSGVGFSGLHGNTFFDLNVDLFYWLPFLSRLPQTIVTNYWLAIMFDIAILLLALRLFYRPASHVAARCLLFLLFIFYITLTAYLGHRNYQTGIFIVLIPFIFRKQENRFFAFEATRYFLLWFYCSAGFLKIFSSSILQVEHLSNFLSHQFAPYFIEHNTGLRTSLNLFLIDHTNIAYLLYILSVLAELSMITGFFTRKYDRFLAVVLLIFHLMNWLIMDISFIGQLSFICLLFLSKRSFLPTEETVKAP